MDNCELDELDEVFKNWEKEEKTNQELSKKQINNPNNSSSINLNNNPNNNDILKLIFVMFYLFTLKYYFDKYNMKDKTDDEINKFMICHHYKILFFATLILNFVNFDKINNFLQN